MKTPFFNVLILVFLLTGCTKQDNTTKPVNSWKTLASMPTARQNFGLVVCNNLLYAVGGYNANGLNSMEVYNPANNSWETKAPMPTARGYLVVAAVADKIYAIGGITGSDLNNITYTNVTEEYDPTTNKWTTKSPFPISANVFNHVLGNEFITGAAINGKIYVAGGNSDVSVPTYIYDPVKDTWSNKGTSIGKFDLQPYFSTATGTDLYVTDGYIFMKYITANNEWRTLQPVPTAVQANCLCAYNDDVYSIGGYIPANDSVSTSNDVEIYNNANALWTKIESLNTKRHSAAAVVYNDNLYVAGGSNKQANYLDYPLSSLEVLSLK